MRASYADCLAALDRLDEARVMVERLIAEGYAELAAEGRHPRFLGLCEKLGIEVPEVETEAAVAPQ